MEFAIANICLSVVEMANFSTFCMPLLTKKACGFFNQQFFSCFEKRVNGVHLMTFLLFLLSNKPNLGTKDY